MASAPPLRYPPLDAALLEEVVRGYERLTGRVVRRLQQRQFIATCWRLQGPPFLELVRLLFERRGTDRNLLGILRTTTPEDIALFLAVQVDERVVEPAIREPSRSRGSAEPEPKPTLTLVQAEPPPEPGHEGFFAPDELGDRSTTARALDR